MSLPLKDRYEHAISLCESLKDALVNIGAFDSDPKTTHRVPVYRNDPSSKIYDLHSSLESLLHSLDTPRNALFASIGRLRLEADTLREVLGYVDDPVSASHVCREWRETALMIPALWSDVTFPLSTSTGDLDSGRHPVFRESKNEVFQRRAGDASLLKTTIHLSKGEGYEEARRAFVVEAPGRVSDLWIDSPPEHSYEDEDEDELPSFVACIQAVCSSLRALSIDWTGGFEDSTASTLFESFLRVSLPQLKYLSLKQCPIPMEDSDEFVALSSLHTLRIEGCNAKMLHVLLKTCSSSLLRELEIRTERKERGTMSYFGGKKASNLLSRREQERIDLPRLEKLNLYISEDAEWPLHLLSPSSLHDLQVRVAYSSVPNPNKKVVPAILGLLEESSETASIRTLLLDTLSTGEARQILQHPSVRNILYLGFKFSKTEFGPPYQGTDYDYAYVDPHRSLNGTPSCTKLRHLYFDLRASPAFLYVLRDMARYRREEGCPLETIELGGWDYGDDVTAAEAYTAEKSLAGRWTPFPAARLPTVRPPSAFAMRKLLDNLPHTSST